MDDWVVLAPTRWKLRAAVKRANQILAELMVEKHPDKTVMGRIEKGFDFLGYHLSPKGLGVARKTIENFLSRATRLYEQESGEPLNSTRLGFYVKRWLRWVRAGLPKARRSCVMQNPALRRWLLLEVGDFTI